MANVSRFLFYLSGMRRLSQIQKIWYWLPIADSELSERRMIMPDLNISIPVKNTSLFLPAGDNVYYIEDHILFILNTNTGSVSRFDLPDQRRKNTITELFWWNQKVHILSGNTIMGLNENTGLFTTDVRENISGGDVQEYSGNK